METTTTLTSAPLETLPLDIFQHICQHVPRRGLFSLSLANRFCCQAATPGRFSRIRLVIVDEERLRSDLHQWIAILARDGRFRHARSVLVVGRMDDSMHSVDTQYGMVEPGVMDDGDDDNNNADDNEDDGIDNDGNADIDIENVRFDPAGPVLSPAHKRAQHEAWLPFAQFLEQLPGLADPMYTCTHQVPAWILAALHQHHPRSRLHVRTFSLRSLYYRRDLHHDLDPDEYELATSPCLYNIRAKCTLWWPGPHQLQPRRHGPSLRKLHLFVHRHDDDDDADARPEDDADCVHSIQQHCSGIEDIRLRVSRRQGRPDEVAVYRALGRLPRLRRATLELDCRVPFPDSNNLASHAERLRKMFVNFAVDETLARAIFHEIAEEASAATAAAEAAQIKAPLLRLRLETCTDHLQDERNPDDWYWARWIARNWVCTRSDARSEVVVRETGVDARARQHLRNVLTSLREELEQSGYEAFFGTDVWTELWPRRAEDWEEDWHSFPLSSGGAEDGM